MSVGIKPLGSRVVIKKLEAIEKTEGGLILSGNAKEKPQSHHFLFFSLFYSFPFFPPFLPLLNLRQVEIPRTRN